MLSSPVFKAMFQPGFLEGGLLRSRDQAEVELPDDNPEAFEILMNVLHGRSRQVPDRIGFALLADLAVLADKY